MLHFRCTVVMSSTNVLEELLLVEWSCPLEEVTNCTMCLHFLGSNHCHNSVETCTKERTKRCQVRLPQSP